MRFVDLTFSKQKKMGMFSIWDSLALALQQEVKALPICLRVK